MYSFIQVLISNFRDHMERKVAKFGYNKIGKERGKSYGKNEEISG